MKRILPTLLALALVSLFSLSSLGQAPPSADAFVAAEQPSANYGNGTSLAVQPGTTSYVRLNLGVLPENASVVKATLRLYVDAVIAPGSFDVYQVDSEWSEKGLNFNNAPPLGASATGGRPVLVAATSLNQFILIDITALAQGWLNGSIPNHGVALSLISSSGSFSFDSKESTGTGHQPELAVVFGGTAVSPTASAVTATVSATTDKGIVSGPSDPYIDNGTALQVGANFNIDGSGSAATFNATSQYELAGAPVLGNSGTQGLFLGAGAGQNNTGSYNLFLGIAAGHSTSAADYNTFIGTNAGYFNTTGTQNFMLGATAGYHNTIGSYNMFVGSLAGYNNTTGTRNAFVGRAAGYGNTTGTGNSFFGANAGSASTADFNTFLGGFSGTATTTGNHNTFVGWQAGQTNVTGTNNTFVGYNAGSAGGTASTNDIYIASSGAVNEVGVVRIGDPANQSSAYIAGINGSSTTAGVPVFVDSTGKLGTDGGSVNFSQVVGTVSSPQFTGTYSNAVTLSNTSNTFNGSFTGNGAGLTGVSSGLSWPIVTKNVDYTIQTNDFSTPTHYGNFVVLTGLVKRTFTLPNPPPPNGSCVGIGNVAQTTGANTYLSVNPNGLNVDGGATAPTHPRRASYLYCSDGTGYWRFGQNQNGVSEIGPWLYTADNGTANVLTTSFLSGLDFGLIHGTMIYLWPANANTSSTPTLNVNQLGAVRIVKFGNQALAPGDLTHTALAHLIFDGNLWQLLNPQTNQGTVTAVTATAPLVSSGGVTPNLSCPTCVTNPTLSGTTGSIGGSALTAGSCTTGTAAVTGAIVGHPVAVSASDGTLPNGFIILSAAVTNPNTVTVQLCATASVTLTANTYYVSTQ